MLRRHAVRVDTRVLVMLLLFVACSKAIPQDAAATLVGRYELTSTAERLLTTTDVLRLHSDGTFVHEGSTKSGDHFSYSGRWRYAQRTVALDDWRDYAGVTTKVPQGSGARVNMNVIVEFTSPPVIVLDPDRNILYAKTDERSGQK